MMRWDVLAKLINENNIETFIEVGTANGKNIRRMLPLLDHYVTILCIDPYTTYTGYNNDINSEKDQIKQNYLDSCNSIFQLPNIANIQLMSEQGAKLFADKSVDMVFIDANHKKPFVLDDISYWLPKVKPGGILSGHDYRISRESGNPNGVKQAVDEWIEKEGIQDISLDNPDTVWYTFIKEETD